MNDLTATEAGYLRAIKRGRMIRFSVLIALGALPVLYIAYQIIDQKLENRRRERDYRASVALSDADEAELRALVAELRPALAADEANWEKAVVRPSLAAMQPSEIACMYALHPPTSTAGNSYATYGSVDANYYGDMRVTTYEARSTLGLGKSHRVAWAVEEVERVARRLDHPDDDDDDDLPRYENRELSKTDLTELRKLRHGLDPEVFAIVTRTEPVPSTSIGGAGGYLAGEISGTAYLYDHRAGAIACVGDIDVTSSPEIKISYSHMAGNVLDEMDKELASSRETLKRDLEVNLERTVASALRSVQD